MSGISHPHNNEELFKTAFDLAKRNLSSKQLPDEILKKLTELDNKINALGKDISLQKRDCGITNTQIIEKLREEIQKVEKEWYTLSMEYTGDFDIHIDGGAIQVFANLEKVLGERIVHEIKNTENGCVLVLGSESALMIGAVSCVY